MREKDVQNNHLERLRSTGKAFVLRITDRMTAGIPDSVVASGGKTTWLEYKVTNARHIMASTFIDNQVQLEVMCQLDYHAHSFYVVYCKYYHKTLILSGQKAYHYKKTGEELDICRGIVAGGFVEEGHGYDRIYELCIQPHSGEFNVRGSSPKIP